MDPAAHKVLSAALRKRAAREPAPIELPGADLSDARLPRANLVGAHIPSARLDHANLSGAKLGRSTASKALFRWAELNGADFTAADLSGADLSWARVEGACFADADLCGASVNGATGEPATIAGARIDKRMCDRSHLDDYDIIQLWRAGATIVDLQAFSPRVKHACGMAGGKEPASEAGPSSRKLTGVEVKALRDRLAGIDHAPPPELAGTVVVPDDTPAPAPASKPRRAPALSMRSMRLVSDVLTPEMLEAPEWRRGDIVMGITLLEPLGSGNAARVWSGRNQEDEPFAVKLFNSDYAKHGLTLPAYRRGVQVMNRLSTQDEAARVVQLHAVSLNQLGFAMAMAANGSAADLPALNWPVESALSFFEKLSTAVGQAHDAGLLHRCLKPSNILLDDELEPILTDFDMIDLPGVAARGGDAGGYAVFAAPEELAGAGSQSPTADVYSLGCMLYFLLIGEEPERPLSRDRALKKIAHLPNGLVRIIRKCTSAMPAERYQYVRDLLADIANYEDGDAVGTSSTRGGSAQDAAVSGLAQTRPWMGHARSLSEAPPPVTSNDQRQGVTNSTLRSTTSDIDNIIADAQAGAKAQPEAARGQRPVRPRPKRRPKPEVGASNTEKLIGASGAVLLLISLLVVEFSATATKSIMIPPMRLLSMVSGAMMVMLAPLPEKNKIVWRLLLAFLGAMILFFLNLPALFG